MDAVAVILAGAGSRRQVLSAAVTAAAAAEAREVVVVTADANLTGDLDATTVVDESETPSEASAVRAVADYAARLGVDELLVALSPEAAAESVAWRRLAAARPATIVVATSAGRPTGLLRLDAVAWPLLPFEGSIARMLSSHPALVVEFDIDAAEEALTAHAGADLEAVKELLGRAPAGGFVVAVRDETGHPVVIRNQPFLDDGTPMPTRYWLVGRQEQELVGRLESTGGVRRAEAEVPEQEVSAAHDRYAKERDAAIPVGHQGPRPSGGVGGTRTRVKCLHAHLAWYLAGGADPVGRWTARALDGQLRGPVAAVDCGTNSTRLLVLGRGSETLARRMTITRLGQGVDESGALAPAAIGRTLDALREYRSLLDEFGVVRVRAAATSAARDASNAEEFFAAAEQVLGVRPELLAGSEEGRLSYLGATAELDPAAAPYLVVDLGGGSTELVAGDAERLAAIAAVVSLDIGCVRVSERFLSQDPPSREQIEAARSFVRTTVAAALDAQPTLGLPRQMVGVAGTVSTLVSLQLGLDHYDSQAVHLAPLSRDEVEQWLAVLSAETSEERQQRGAIEAGRADVIVAGALVLAETMAVLGHERLVHSERDILDGIASELLVS